jgi:hypothetical protein
MKKEIRHCERSVAICNSSSTDCHASLVMTYFFFHFYYHFTFALKTQMELLLCHARHLLYMLLI